MVSLGDISIYTTGDDVPLADVFESISKVADGKPVDVKGLNDTQVRDEFRKALPDFDDERVYTADIRKVYAWYNQLIAAGVTKFKDDEIAEDQAAEAAEKADSEQA